MSSAKTWCAFIFRPRSTIRTRADPSRPSWIEIVPFLVEVGLYATYPTGEFTAARPKVNPQVSSFRPKVRQGWMNRSCHDSHSLLERERLRDHDVMEGVASKH